LPTTFLFDKQGRRVGQAKVGAINIDQFDAQLSQLVDQ
jgi:hypothetical protein